MTRGSVVALWLGVATTGMSPAHEPARPSSAQTVPAESVPIFADIPNITISYYDVTGRTGAEVRQSMNAKRPHDSHDGKRVDALSRWSMRWRWRGDGRGGCDLATTQVAYSATVLMPRLADPAALPAADLARWRRYLVALQRHEDEHLRHAHEQVDRVLAAIRGATCATATATGQAMLTDIAKHDVAYDRRTRHGITQGATFP